MANNAPIKVKIPGIRSSPHIKPKICAPKGSSNYAFAIMIGEWNRQQTIYPDWPNIDGPTQLTKSGQKDYPVKFKNPKHPNYGSRLKI
jgi:hypothetical protein